MSILALATDIDATLTDVSRRISSSAVDALRNVEARGIPVILVSGNVLPMCHSLNVYIGLSGPVVAENGGVVFWKKGPRMHLFKNRKEAERGYEHICNHFPLKKVLTDRWRETEVAVEEAGVDIRELRRLLKEGNFNLYANSTGYGIHIMEPGLSKLEGLKMACSWLGVAIPDVLAMGDSETDMEFLGACGASGVPANASGELKAMAGYVSPLPFGDGAVDILRHYGLL